MDLKCDSIICAPPRGANPLAALFPELMSARRPDRPSDTSIPKDGRVCPMDYHSHHGPIMGRGRSDSVLALTPGRGTMR
jgi:hypothetical protein